MKLIHTNKLII